MTKITGHSYDATRITREINKLSQQEQLLLIGAVYCASRKENLETLRGFVERFVENPSQGFTDAVNEISCLEPVEQRHLLKRLRVLYFS